MIPRLISLARRALHRHPRAIEDMPRHPERLRRLPDPVQDAEYWDIDALLVALWVVAFIRTSPRWQRGRAARQERLAASVRRDQVEAQAEVDDAVRAASARFEHGRDL